MSVLPVGATWVEDAKRASATVTATGQAVYRDFAMVWQRALNLRWANGRPVEGIASEGMGVPNDPKDNAGMAINYKTEPLWYRFGLAPDAPFGRADGSGYGDVPNAHMAYSNALVGGDPQTPVFYVKPGQPFRLDLPARRSPLVGQSVPGGEERCRRLSDVDPRRRFGAVRPEPDVDVHRRTRKRAAGRPLQRHAPERRWQQCDCRGLPVP
jgi:hypothetical protein